MNEQRFKETEDAVTNKDGRVRKDVFQRLVPRLPEGRFKENIIETGMTDEHYSIRRHAARHSLPILPEGSFKTAMIEKAMSDREVRVVEAIKRGLEDAKNQSLKRSLDAGMDSGRRMAAQKKSERKHGVEVGGV